MPISYSILTYDTIEIISHVLYVSGASILLLVFWNFFIVVIVAIRYQRMNELTREEKGKTGRKQNHGRVENVLSIAERDLRWILSSPFVRFCVCHAEKAHVGRWTI